MHKVGDDPWKAASVKPSIGSPTQDVPPQITGVLVLLEIALTLFPIFSTLDLPSGRPITLKFQILYVHLKLVNANTHHKHDKNKKSAGLTLRTITSSGVPSVAQQDGTIKA